MKENILIPEWIVACIISADILLFTLRMKSTVISRISAFSSLQPFLIYSGRKRMQENCYFAFQLFCIDGISLLKTRAKA